jgi:hypothetical protein
MSDDNGSPVGEVPSVALPADAPESFDSPNAAAAYFTSLREKPDKEQPAESAPEATAEPELAEANADPETAPSEEPNEIEPEELPPIDPPRSWTQAEKERFQSLPRETQEYLHTREQEREREFRRSQNDIAEQRKAIEAERSKAEQVRQQYEAQLPALMQELQSAQQATFSDIKTLDDVVKLQNEDPFRFQAWQVQQMRLQAANAENERVKGEKSKAEQAQWTQHVQKENELAAEYIPELADKTKGPALTQRAAERLNELGFKSEELAKLASGQEKLSLYDHRIQRLIFSDLKLSDIQSATKAVAAKPLPPVQKPGISKPAGSSVSEREQVLTRQLNETGDLRIAQELYALQSSRRKAS